MPARASHPVNHPPPALPADTRLRPACTDDLEALLALEEICFTTDRISRRSFRRLIGGDRSRLTVLERAGQVLGYALVLLRRGTGLARLYSLAVQPAQLGQGLGRCLLQDAERAAIAENCVFMRLEVALANEHARRLYEAAGYAPIRQLPDYYGDGAHGVRMEKVLAPTGPQVIPERVVPYYEQSTDFTCGPACLLMALAHFDPAIRPDPVLEVRLWREATTVFMSSGLGGCEPVGMALALRERGLDCRIHVSEPGPFLLQTVTAPEKRRVMALAQLDFQRRASALAIPMHGPLPAVALAAELNAGALAIVLISGNRMFGQRVPHWVLAYAATADHILIHDPWVETSALESATNAIGLPVPFAEFDRMSRYGRSGLRATVLVAGPLATFSDDAGGEQA